MRSQHSLEEIAELYGLLENIKKEYENGIHHVLKKSNPELFSNPHTIPKLKKISINRGLGLAAQNTTILKRIDQRPIPQHKKTVNKLHLQRLVVARLPNQK